MLTKEHKSEEGRKNEGAKDSIMPVMPIYQDSLNLSTSYARTQLN